MKRPETLVSLLVCFGWLLYFSSCSSNPSRNGVIDNNPNGSSELAMLMKEMYVDLDGIKSSEDHERIISLLSKHKNILTAEATEPDKAASETYKIFAESYLENLKRYEEASSDLKDAHYLNLVNSCMNCHKALCPGPLVKIKKLME